MKRNSCETPIRMSELPVRPALPYFHKPKVVEDVSDFPWLKNRDVSHNLRHNHTLSSNKFGIHLWLAFFQKHAYHFLEISA